MIGIGASLAALPMELFLVPNKIIDRGIIDISVILDCILPDQVGFLSFVTLVVLQNSPFMYYGYNYEYV
jgi:uncharacterized membrane-anchored protein YitT (DUF2179 family)